MTEKRLVYEVSLPLPGSPGVNFTLLRAETPQGVGEVVEILLRQKDPNVNVILITAVEEIKPVRY